MPVLSPIPNRFTRAITIWVAFSISLEAPVVTLSLPNIISSAIPPPKGYTYCSPSLCSCTHPIRRRRNAESPTPGAKVLYNLCNTVSGATSFVMGACGFVVSSYLLSNREMALLSFSPPQLLPCNRPYPHQPSQSVLNPLGCEYSSFIHQVLKLRPLKTPSGAQAFISIPCQRFVSAVNFQDFNLPFISGSPISTCLSNRPGRSRASSAHQPVCGRNHYYAAV